MFMPWSPPKESLEPLSEHFQMIEQLAQAGKPVELVQIGILVDLVNSIGSSAVKSYGHLSGQSSRVIRGEPGNCIAFAEAHHTILGAIGVEQRGIVWHKFGHAACVCLIAGYVINIEPKGFGNEIALPSSDGSVNIVDAPVLGAENKVSSSTVPARLFRRGLRTIKEYPVFDMYEKKDGTHIAQYPPYALKMPEFTQLQTHENTIMRIYTGREVDRFLPNPNK